MATRKAPAKKKPVKKVAEDSENGATRTRRDRLEGLSEAKRRNIARLIFRERSKSPSTSWGDISQMVEDKYDWTLPGSMTGRRLLRDYGPDGAEEAIIKQDRTNAKKDSAKAKATTTKRKKKVVVEEDEDLEDEDEDELDEEMEVDEDEDEDEYDEDEDEDEEDEEPAPKAKKVKVTRGRGRKANPS